MSLQCYLPVLLLVIFASISAISSGPTVICSQEEYVCRGGRTCISGTFICDGVIDCPQGDDEDKCHQQTSSSRRANRSCPVGLYDCTRSDVCVPFSSVCDGKIDCPFGDDELSASCGQRVDNSNNQQHNNNHERHKRDTSSNKVLENVTGVDAQDLKVDDQGTKATSKGNEKDKGGLPGVPFDIMGLGDQFIKKPGANDSMYHVNDTSAEGIKVKATKLIPSRDFKPITYTHHGSGYFFINFGNIVNGNENVNGPGNDIGNGNGNGNGNGGGNGGGYAEGNGGHNGDQEKGASHFENVGREMEDF